jgi:hypothetical protein
MSLSNREEKLALGVFAVLVLAILAVGTSRVRAWRTALWEREAELANREAEATELRNGGTLWEERQQWIESHLPRHPNAGEARSSLVSAVQEAAGTHGVTLQSQKLIDPEAPKPDADGEPPPPQGPPGFALQVTATGDLRNIVLWWQELLRPEHFRQMNFLKLIPDDDTTDTIRCTAEIWQWYQLAPESAGDPLSAAP